MKRTGGAASGRDPAGRRVPGSRSGRRCPFRRRRLGDASEGPYPTSVGTFSGVPSPSPEVSMAMMGAPTPTVSPSPARTSTTVPA